MNQTVEDMEEIVQVAIEKTAVLKEGIDNNEFDVWVAGFGAVHPIINYQTGDIAFHPCWYLGVRLRHTLLGHQPVAATCPVIGVLPKKIEMEKAAEQLFSRVVRQRDKEFDEARAGVPKITPEQITKAMKNAAGLS